MSSQDPTSWNSGVGQVVPNIDNDLRWMIWSWWPREDLFTSIQRNIQSGDWMPASMLALNSATVQSQLHTQLQLPARTHPGRWKICTELWAPSFGSAPLQPLQTCGEWARGWTCSYILSFPNYQTYKWNNSRKQKKAVACYAQDLLEWGYENPRVWH